MTWPEGKFTTGLIADGKLTTDKANELYQDGWSPCEIARAYGRSRTGDGVRRMIWWSGLVWCTMHRRYEEKFTALCPTVL